MNISGSRKDFDVHVSGKRHQLKVAANSSNAHQLAAPSNSVSIAKSPHDVSYTAAANEQIAEIDDKRVHIGTASVANLPDLTTLSVSDNESEKAENSLQPTVTTSEMVAGQCSNHNSNGSSADMESKVYKKTIIIGINGNQIPGNKIAVVPVTNGSDILCDICNVRDVRFSTNSTFAIM